METTACPNKGHRWGCCCHCSMHFPLNGHPCVDGNSIMTRIGWVCTVFAYQEGCPKGAILSNEHGQCEMFEEELRRVDD